MSFVFRCDEVDSNRLRPHLLRTSDYCWCDKDAMNHFAEVQDLTFHRCMALYVQVTYRSMYRDYSVQLIEFTVYHCVTNTIASITIHFNTLRIVFRIYFFSGICCFSLCGGNHGLSLEGPTAENRKGSASP